MATDAELRQALRERGAHPTDGTYTGLGPSLDAVTAQLGQTAASTIADHIRRLPTLSPALAELLIQADDIVAGDPECQ